MEVSFADKGKSYTRLFSSHVIAALQEIKVQNAVAGLFCTSPYTETSYTVTIEGITEDGILIRKTEKIKRDMR